MKVETSRPSGRQLEDEKDTYFPEVYWDVTRSRCLGLEEIKGVQLSHWNEADLSMEERAKIVRIGSGKHSPSGARYRILPCGSTSGQHVLVT